MLKIDSPLITKTKQKLCCEWASCARNEKRLWGKDWEVKNELLKKKKYFLSISFLRLRNLKNQLSSRVMLALSQAKKKSMLPIPILEKLEGKSFGNIKANSLKKRNINTLMVLLNKLVLHLHSLLITLINVFNCYRWNYQDWKANQEKHIFVDSVIVQDLFFVREWSGWCKAYHLPIQCYKGV